MTSSNRKKITESLEIFGNVTKFQENPLVLSLIVTKYFYLIKSIYFNLNVDSKQP